MSADRVVHLFVAGPGKASEEEVADLLEDSFPANDVATVNIYYPMISGYFTPAVKAVLAWAGNPDNGGSNAGITWGEGKPDRSAKRAFHVQEEDVNSPDAWVFDDFPDAFSDLEFEKEDETYFLAAVPGEEEEVDDDTFNELVTWVEAAQEQGIDVLNLCAGLDSVNDEDTKSNKPEPTPEPVVDGLQEQVNHAAIQAGKDKEPDLDPFPFDESNFKKWYHNLKGLSLHELLVVKAAATMVQASQVAPEKAAAVQEAPTPVEAVEEPQEPAEPARRGRGRPRTKPRLENQIWDEEANPEDGTGGAWVPRKKGRVPRDARTRTVDLDTGKVTEGEGAED